jgi:hypothetical protein
VTAFDRWARPAAEADSAAARTAATAAGAAEVNVRRRPEVGAGQGIAAQTTTCRFGGARKIHADLLWCARCPLKPTPIGWFR